MTVAREPAPDTLAPGQHIASYRIERLLGRGGMGSVYAAVHTGIGRPVAIKVLHAEHAAVPELARRFFDEARAVNLIGHPNIVDIYDVGQTADGAAYLVMEYLHGQPLATRMRWSGGRLGHATLRFARQIAAALAAAHARGVVHRDLKPDNVMIVGDPEMPDGERVKVLDFGIAKLGAAHGRPDPRRTARASIMGTPTYMAPEQCRGAESVDPQADVYALGVMLYQLLAGRPPFVARTLTELLAMHQFATPAPLTDVDPHVPARLAELVHAMLAKEPPARPSMSRVAAELDAIGQVSAAVPVARGVRMRAIALVGGMALASAIIAGAIAAVVMRW
ncbi:MAG TPA: serine/threonine-protein kinase [Kofleriaceae bacterium]|nr:serine/threonine-protein kinase [Kofleriaceae bacterium]